jgi:hypothetical protein
LKLEVKDNCPLNGFKKCKQLECSWFIKVQGTDPNSGKEVEEYACAISWLPTLLIENSHQQRMTGGAVESFRNEMVKSNYTSQEVLKASLGLQPDTLKVIGE